MIRLKIVYFFERFKFDYHLNVCIARETTRTKTMVSNHFDIYGGLIDSVVKTKRQKSIFSLFETAKR